MSHTHAGTFSSIISSMLAKAKISIGNTSKKQLMSDENSQITRRRSTSPSNSV